MSQLQILEQRRATAALNYIKAIKDLGDSQISTSYKSYCKSFPMWVKTNGLAAAVAFVKSKRKPENKKNAYNYLYDHLGQWLKECDLCLMQDDSGDLASFVLKSNSYVYRSLTNEALAFFTWMRRLVDSEIEDKKEENKEADE